MSTEPQNRPPAPPAKAARPIRLRAMKSAVRMETHPNTQRRGINAEGVS
jgi:hypothetical protein